jgi:serine-type D-Ala-D-Ala carboxypeptidase/endopeptidase (penicillin-binding protein 4)
MRLGRALAAALVATVAWAAPADARPAHKAKVRRAHHPAAEVTGHARVSIGGAHRGGEADTWRRQKDSELTLEERTAKRIEELLRGPLRMGTTGLYVVDADTGKELFAVHPDDPLNPASNVKLISTATALDTLGADFRYTTRLLGPTPEADGTIHGDVYLLGGYDPTLDPGAVSELADALAARGVHSIDGDLVVGPEATRDGIFRARIKVIVHAAARGKPPEVTLSPATDYTVLAVDATTARSRRSKLHVSATREADDDGHPRLRIAVSGTVGRGRTLVRWIWPKDRGPFTAELLRADLGKVGVTTTGGVRVAELAEYASDAGSRGWLPVELGVHQSDRLADIVARVNKRSINWLADRVVMTAAAARTGASPTMSDALDAMYAWLGANAGLARKDLFLDSGSGLSHKTEFSPREIVKVLRAGSGLAQDDDADLDPHDQACHAAYVHSLSIAGVDGTLRHRFKNAIRGRLLAKTGTLNQSIALSGFLDAAPGHTLVFALVTNGAPGQHYAVRKAHEKVVAVLYDYATEKARADEATATRVAHASAPVAAPDAGAVTPPAETPTAPPAEADDDDDEHADQVEESELESEPETDLPAATPAATP